MTKRKAVEIDQEEVSNGRKYLNKRKDKTPKDISEGDLDTELRINHALNRMNPCSLVDRIAKRTARFQPSLASSITDEMHIYGMCFYQYESFVNAHWVKE